MKFVSSICAVGGGALLAGVTTSFPVLPSRNTRMSSPLFTTTTSSPVAVATTSPPLTILNSIDWMCALNTVQHCVTANDDFCSVDDVEVLSSTMEDERLVLQQRWDELQDTLHQFHHHVVKAKQRQRRQSLEQAGAMDPVESFYSSIQASLSMESATVKLPSAAPKTEPFGLFGPDEKLVYPELMSSIDTMCMTNMAKFYMLNDEEDDDVNDDHLEMMEAIQATLQEQRDMVQARLVVLDMSLEQLEHRQLQQQQQQISGESLASRSGVDHDNGDIPSLLQAINQVLREQRQQKKMEGEVQSV